jgi:hypothetical protein
MTRARDPVCPFAGAPCLLALDDLLLEYARAKAREDSRPTGPCRACGELSMVALAGEPRCYRCVSGKETEKDHPKGSGSGPAILRMDSNAHRIANESERIWGNVGRGDLCPPCRAGFSMRIGILMARLEVAS